MAPVLAYSSFFQFRYVTVMLLHHHLRKNYGLASQAFPEKVGILFTNPETRPRVVLPTMRHMKQLMGQKVKTHSIMPPTYSPCILNQQHQMMKDITICLKLQPNLISNYVYSTINGEDNWVLFSNVKVPISWLGILHSYNIWNPVIRIAIYLVVRKFYLRGLCGCLTEVTSNQESVLQWIHAVIDILKIYHLILNRIGTICWK